MHTHRGINRRTFLTASGIGAAGLLAGRVPAAAGASLAGSKPNIILVLTDDQGYGELGCHGNTKITTPNIDAMHKRSVRFTDFHVSPTCAPTRASLMAGKHEFYAGVTHTIHERERLGLEQTTVAQMLKGAGYTTGIFGKWHLGDQDTHQPGARGFDEVYIHGAGGIGQSYPGSCGDAPGNKYFDPAIRHNGTFVKTKGYCTDLFFGQAMTWIDAKRTGDRPFFAYISTNAPHGPLVVDEKYSAPYVKAGLGKGPAAYYGMITNIDENMGVLVKRLKEWGLSDKTLLIFMTDNGHSQKGLFNAGMKGGKGGTNQGGTRVPAFFEWTGRLDKGVDVDKLTGAIDFFPTAAELAGVKVPGKLGLQGRSLVPLLADADAEWPNRYIFSHKGRWAKGKAAASKYSTCSVRDERFRLVNNKELHDIRNDPGERTNVIDKNPDVVAAMRKAYDAWWEGALPCMVNENAPVPRVNPFKEAYGKQFGKTDTPSRGKKRGKGK